MRNVIILGCGRSGTSMVAGCFRNAGYFMGERLYEPRESNPKGFFESHFVNFVNEQILETLPATSYLTRPSYWYRWMAAITPDARFPDTGQPRRDIVSLVSHVPFCYKDPRFSYTLPVWRPYLDGTVFICVFRQPERTAVSMVREVEYVRGTFGAKVTLNWEQALLSWRCTYTSILSNYRDSELWIFAHYDQVVDGSVLDKIEEIAEATLDRSFPESCLSRSAARSDIVRDADIEALYRELCRRARISTGSPKNI
jgi:hypothetical protein